MARQKEKGMASNTKRPAWAIWLRGYERGVPNPALGAIPDLAGLTGQDTRALAAVAACWELYFASDGDGRDAAILSIAALLVAMQAKYVPLARALIPFAGDWSHIEEAWSAVCERSVRVLPADEGNRG